MPPKTASGRQPKPTQKAAEAAQLKLDAADKKSAAKKKDDPAPPAAAKPPTKKSAPTKDDPTQANPKLSIKFTTKPSLSSADAATGPVSDVPAPATTAPGSSPPRRIITPLRFSRPAVSKIAANVTELEEEEFDLFAEDDEEDEPNAAVTKSSKRKPEPAKKQPAKKPATKEPDPRPTKTPAGIDTDDIQEAEFSNRPSVKISLPDPLKNLLVDDWENVTKSGLVVPLPAQKPANFILDTYYHEAAASRAQGSSEATILQEFCAGMKVYFEKALPKILLYRFERAQLSEVRLWWEKPSTPEWEGKNCGDCYGGEHLVRLLVNLPELMVQTNMDQESMNRLKTEVMEFAGWMAANSKELFIAKYEKPENAFL